MSIGLGVFLVGVVCMIISGWVWCGRFNHECSYGWSWDLWNNQWPILTDTWEAHQKTHAIHTWRPWSYASGPIGSLIILISGDVKYRRKVGS